MLTQKNRILNEVNYISHLQQMYYILKWRVSFNENFIKYSLRKKRDTEKKAVKPAEKNILDFDKAKLALVDATISKLTKLSDVFQNTILERQCSEDSNYLKTYVKEVTDIINAATESLDQIKLSSHTTQIGDLDRSLKKTRESLDSCNELLDKAISIFIYEVEVTAREYDSLKRQSQKFKRFFLDDAGFACKGVIPPERVKEEIRTDGIWYSEVRDFIFKNHHENKEYFLSNFSSKKFKSAPPEEKPVTIYVLDGLQLDHVFPNGISSRTEGKISDRQLLFYLGKFEAMSACIDLSNGKKYERTEGWRFDRDWTEEERAALRNKYRNELTSQAIQIGPLASLAATNKAPSVSPNVTFKEQLQGVQTGEPPLEFRCPLSLQLMEDPVTFSGVTFDRQSLVDAMRESKTPNELQLKWPVPDGFITFGKLALDNMSTTSYVKNVIQDYVNKQKENNKINHNLEEKSDHEEVVVPSRLCCPISLKLMRDPITPSCGITFDRQSLINLFNRHPNQEMLLLNWPNEGGPKIVFESEASLLTTVIVKREVKAFLDNQEGGEVNELANEDVREADEQYEDRLLPPDGWVPPDLPDLEESSNEIKQFENEPLPSEPGRVSPALLEMEGDRNEIKQSSDEDLQELEPGASLPPVEMNIEEKRNITIQQRLKIFDGGQKQSSEAAPASISIPKKGS